MSFSGFFMSREKQNNTVKVVLEGYHTRFR